MAADHMSNPSRPPRPSPEATTQLARYLNEPSQCQASRVTRRTNTQRSQPSPSQQCPEIAMHRPMMPAKVPMIYLAKLSQTPRRAWQHSTRYQVNNCRTHSWRWNKRRRRNPKHRYHPIKAPSYHRQLITSPSIRISSQMAHYPPPQYKAYAPNAPTESKKAEY